MFVYTEEKKFTKEQVQQLFLSVHWISGKYPERLYKALMNSSTVLTIWDDEKLVGLTRVLDDTEMLAQIHYVLVHPDYQGKGIAGKMISMCNVAVGAVTNIILDAVFINGIGMGVKGAVLATVISQGTTAPMFYSYYRKLKC